MNRTFPRFAGLLLIVLAISPAVLARESLSPEMRAKIDAAVNDVLSETGAPSASIAVVKDGEIAWTNAYGMATLDPKKAATLEMRYSIGSISKQFTAAAILLLAEEGRLSLDDRLVRWFPELTRAGDVTIRQLLSMTSGYQDFWPQDYVMPRMLEPVSSKEIFAEWGSKPLDFEPGAKWQYSNTNYVIAGVIIERVSGMPLLDFLRERVFTPLDMESVTNTDEGPLGPEDPTRYMRYALAGPRPAPKEGKGWMFAAGELAMTASDLARWDIAMMDQRILKPESWRLLEKEVQLNDGVGTGYALGVGVSLVNGRRRISHGGEVSGFTARNEVYPDDRVAIVVQTNLDATGASSQIASKIGDLLFKTTDEIALEQVRTIFEGLRHGKIDRSLFTSNANAYFSEQALEDFSSSLSRLGKVKELTQQSQSLRGGMTLRRYRVTLAKKTLRITTFTMPDGLIEQYQVAATE